MTQAEEPRITLEDIRKNVNSAGYFRLLDMQVDAGEGGMGAVRVQVDERLMHAQQIVHGGVIFTLADTAMSMALIAALPPQTRFSTIEAKINYLAPVVTGELSAEGTIVQRGRSIAVLEATVYNHKDEEKMMVARTLATFHISASKQTSATKELQ